MKIHFDFDIRIGRVVKRFILADLTFLAGWGFIEPLFAVFVVRHIAGATLVTVGISAGIYWFLKSILQIPLANYLDHTRGEKDDFYALIIGLIMAATSAFLFVFIDKAWQLYAVQAVHAAGFALYIASYPAIFSRHLDKDRVSFDWALNSTAVGLAAGVTGLLGGVVAAKFGFTPVFVAGGFLTLVAAFVLMLVPDIILPETTSRSPRHDHIGADIHL